MTESQKVGRMAAVVASNQAGAPISMTDLAVLKSTSPLRNVPPDWMVNVNWPTAVADMINTFSDDTAVTMDVFACSSNMAQINISARQAIVMPATYKTALQLLGNPLMPPYRTTIAALPVTFDEFGHALSPLGVQVNSLNIGTDLEVYGFVFRIQGNNLERGNSSITIEDSDSGVTATYQLDTVDDTGYVTYLACTKASSLAVSPILAEPVVGVSDYTFPSVKPTNQDQLVIVPKRFFTPGLSVKGMNATITIYPLYGTREFMAICDGLYYGNAFEKLPQVINAAYAGF